MDLKEIILSGDVGWEITPENLRSQLKGAGDVKIFVNSPGGYVWDGVELFNIIKDHNGYVEVVINALGASAASFFPLAADRVIVRATTTMMIHNASGIAFGGAKQMKKTADLLEGLDGIIASYYVNKTGKSLDEIKQAMSDETWFFGGQSAVDFGIADEVLEEEEIDEDKKEEDFDNVKLKENQAKALVDGVFSKMRKQNNDEAMKMVAKLIKINNKSISPKNKKVTKTKTKKEAVSMSLQKLLENKEVKAEYDASLEVVRNEEKERFTASLKNEKERVNEILNLSGVILTKEITDAIENGLSSGEYAKNKILASNKVLDNARNESESNPISTSPDQSTTDFSDQEMSEADKSISNVDKAFANRYGKDQNKPRIAG